MSLIATAPPTALPLQTGPDPRIRELVDRYLEMELPNLAPATAYSREYMLRRFAGECGELRISQCRAINLHEHVAGLDGVKSDAGKNAVLVAVKRLINWALDLGLVDGKNPFARVRQSITRGACRTMTDAEFQGLMRVADPQFRRVLIFLKSTGARPCEMASMRWADVRFEQHLVVLKEHKTGRKTGRPRRIPLVPTVVKLLLWMRTHRQVSTIGLVERFLKNGPVKYMNLIRHCRAFGVSHRGVNRARTALGVVRDRVGGDGPKGYYTYRLPDDHEPLPEPELRDFVFLNCLWGNYGKCTITQKVLRLRRRAGLSEKCTAYGLRRRYGTLGVKRGVPIKFVAMAMGHTNCLMLERHYCDEDALQDEMQNAALQIAYGKGAFAVTPEQTTARRPVQVLKVPPVEDIPATTERLPTRVGLERPRPQVPIEGAEATVSANGSKVESMLEQVLKRLATPEPSKGRQRSPAPASLTTAQQNAYEAHAWATATNPELSNASDTAVFRWLQGRPEFAGKLPPLVDTFRRYLSAARLFHDTRKRVLRNRELLPVPAVDDDELEGGAA
jgi:integrase